MSFDPKDILPLIPAAFSTAKELANLVSPKATAAVSFSQRITEFVIAAEATGLSPEVIVEKLDELVLEMKATLKYGS